MSTTRPPRYTKVDGAVTISGQQRTKALKLLEEDPTMGTRQALARSGVKGTRGQIGEAIDDELRAAALEARGWKVESAENALYRVAIDVEHDHWDRANARFLKAFGGPRYRDNAQVELVGAGGGPVRIEHERRLTLADVAAFARSIDGSRDGVGGELPAPRLLLAESGED